MKKEEIINSPCSSLSTYSFKNGFAIFSDEVIRIRKNRETFSCLSLLCVSSEAGGKKLFHRWGFCPC